VGAREATVNTPAPVPERRRDAELRALFNEVLARVETFVDPARTWGRQPLTMWVYRVVRESCPHLDAVQVQALVTATQRVYHARQARRAGARVPVPVPVDAEAEAEAGAVGGPG